MAERETPSRASQQVPTTCHRTSNRPKEIGVRLANLAETGGGENAAPAPFSQTNGYEFPPFWQELPDVRGGGRKATDRSYAINCDVRNTNRVFPRPSGGEASARKVNNVAINNICSATPSAGATQIEAISGFQEPFIVRLQKNPFRAISRLSPTVRKGKG
ncbi:branched-chain amino acid ABC transporter, periplasmic amino acid-binding protein, putative [Anopheles sinensis]|uniref:Branched-chain amino acid ABC transporter, periplasmic amino acid-binding protein, putative n=1 Tax=Anopheles sinensis TaxID=74873 RepID=A0A084W931_ANOSI|nr:branched-chain amino acid ABC transporter, periplasmic amino acid-binding protein, putative [Anopheles sinensis]